MNNNKINILQSFAIVAVMFLIIFVVFMKYVPLYRIYHVNRGGHNNNSVSKGNVENNTVSSPAIKSPIAFLIVNFVYAYAIIIIIICFYGIFGWPPRNVVLTIGKLARRPCDIESPVETSASDVVLISQIAEDDVLIPETIPLQILPETMDSSNVATDYHCSWEGDWNKYRLN